MPSLYEIMEDMKDLFSAGGFTPYDINEFDHGKVSRLPASEFPVVFIGRQIETIDNDASPTAFLNQTAGIDINVVFNTGRAELENDADTNLRSIKDIVYTNQRTNNWCNWIMIDNFVAQLAGTNDRSEVYGGININTQVEYRENRIST